MLMMNEPATAGVVAGARPSPLPTLESDAKADACHTISVRLIDILLGPIARTPSCQYCVVLATTGKVLGTHGLSRDPRSFGFLPSLPDRQNARALAARAA